MPNFQDRVIQGSGTRGSVGTYKTESLPNITGGFGSGDLAKTSDTTSHLPSDIAATGAFYGSRSSGNSYINDATFSTWFLNGSIAFDASRWSSTYKNSAPVQQNALLIQCCIKY